MNGLMIDDFIGDAYQLDRWRSLHGRRPLRWAPAFAFQFGLGRFERFGESDWRKAAVNGQSRGIGVT